MGISHGLIWRPLKKLSLIGVASKLPNNLTINFEPFILISTFKNKFHFAVQTLRRHVLYILTFEIIVDLLLQIWRLNAGVYGRGNLSTHQRACIFMQRLSLPKSIYIWHTWQRTSPTCNLWILAPPELGLILAGLFQGVASGKRKGRFARLPMWFHP